jgi:hypothetical protein
LPLLRGYLQAVLKLMLELCVATDVESAVRASAFETIRTVLFVVRHDFAQEECY